MSHKITNLIAKAAVFALMLMTLMPLTASAYSQITSRSTTMSTSNPSATGVSYTFTFTPATSETIGAVGFSICDQPYEVNSSCTQTAGAAGASLSGAALNVASPTSTAFQTGWAVGTAAECGSGTAATNICIYNGTGTAVNNTTSYSIQLTGITNPSSANTEFYTNIFITTVAGASTVFTAPIDFGAEALSTAQQLTVSGTMPESLVFCVGVTANANCTTVGGGAVSLGTFSPTSTSTATSQMGVSTNAGSGYAVTINGTTLTSGANPIPACATACASTVGTSQFGTNLVANTSPAVGANVTPTGTGYNGAAASGYNTANSFLFVPGNTVASSSNVSSAQQFENSYMVNVAGSQAAGVYTATLTYICTATF